MNAPECSRFERSISAQRAGMLKMTTDQRCECCSNRISPVLLEIHSLPGVSDRDRELEPAAHILLLCPACHALVHTPAVSGREQRLLVRTRSTGTEQRIMKVFRQAPYTPPPSPDPEELFAAALSCGGMDLFLNGA